MIGGRRGRLILRLQRSHGWPKLGPPPAHLSDPEQNAWRDAVGATFIVLIDLDELRVSMAASTLAKWRSGDREPGLLRITYALLGDLFIPMRERRRLLFPDRLRRR